MGQHTWFVKNLDLLRKEEQLFEKLDSHERGDSNLSENEIEEIENEIYKIDEVNKAEYHDLFRTDKRNPDKSYIDYKITSAKECLEWIEDKDNLVTFGGTIFDTPEQIADRKKFCYEKLEEFWSKYPNGAIYFC